MFIDSFRFMSTSLSTLADNLSEKTHGDKCRVCKSELNYMSFGFNKLIFQSSECKKNYMKDFNKELIKRFAKTCGFCNGDINKFILLLRKEVYLYEYMDSWEKFNETSLPDKKAFYSKLNLEDITHKDYDHAEKVFEESKLKKPGAYVFQMICLYLSLVCLSMASLFKKD